MADYDQEDIEKKKFEEYLQEVRNEDTVEEIVGDQVIVKAVAPQNPLTVKSNSTLNSSALVQQTLGYSAQMSSTTGKRWISIQAYNQQALYDIGDSANSEIGLIISVTRKPSNGTGWDEVTGIDDATNYNTSDWSPAGGGSPAGSMTSFSTSTHMGMTYSNDAFNPASGQYNIPQNNGITIITVQVNFQSGHVEYFDIDVPVGANYSAHLEYNMFAASTSSKEQIVKQCENKATTEFYTKGANYIKSPNQSTHDYAILTRYEQDQAFNPSGTLGEYGLYEQYNAGDTLNLLNPINYSWGDPLTDIFGDNGKITPDQNQTGKQVFKRIDVLTQSNNNSYLNTINNQTPSDIETQYQNLSQSTWIDVSQQNAMSSTTSYNDVVSAINLNNQFAQYFTSTIYYSENITSCTAAPPNKTYVVCDTFGNPSYYLTTSLDCQGNTIPLADLPGGSNYNNITFVHSGECCTTCDLDTTGSTVNASYGLNNGRIEWSNLDSFGAPTGQPFQSVVQGGGSLYTVVLTDASNTVIGVSPPTGGTNFTDSTCDVVTTAGAANVVSCNASNKIFTGMQVSGPGIPSDTFVSVTNFNTIGTNVTSFSLINSTGQPVNATVAGNNVSLIFATGPSGTFGSLAPTTVSNPYYTLKCTDDDGCSTSTPFTIAQNAAPPTGCTDSNAVNYDSTAVNDDGSCLLCSTTTGHLEDSTGTNSTALFDSFLQSSTAATINNSATPTWNSDGILNVSATPIATIIPYLTFDANSKFEIKLYKTVNQNEASTAAGASLISTTNAGTLNTVSLAAHSYTALDYGFYTLRFSYVDTNSTSTMEDCWTEFSTYVQAEVCDDPTNTSYHAIPSVSILRSVNSNLCAVVSQCCVLDPIIETFLDPNVPCSGTYIESSIDCSSTTTGMLVNVDWLYSSDGITYTSIGTYALGSVSGVSSLLAYSGNNSAGTNFVASNGAGYYKVEATCFGSGYCVLDQTIQITPLLVGCMDPLSYNYNVSAVCPGLCIFPSWDCEPITGICVDPWTGTTVGYTPGTYNCLTGTGCCNSYCIPPPTPGCTDSCATNYDVSASVDDGSCTYTACTDPTASNQYMNCCNNITYSPAQIVGADNSCCIFPCLPANIITVISTDSTSTCTTFNNDGSVTASLNVNSSATSWNFAILDNTMTTVIYSDPITYPGSVSTNTYSLLGLGSYFVEITDNLGCVWTHSFTIGSTSPKVGCTDPNADNYDPLAVCDCCCQVAGCLDPTASNYNPNANTGGQCDYPPLIPSPCLPKTVEEDKLKIKACLSLKGSKWLRDYTVGMADECTLMNKWKLILIDYLISQDETGLDCLFNCADIQTPDPTSVVDCDALWRTGGGSTGLNHDTNHLGASIINIGEGTTATGYDNYPNGWFGKDIALNPSNNFSFVGDVIKWDLPTGHPLASSLNGTIWTLTKWYPGGAHFGCKVSKINHYTQCLDYRTISITTTANYYDKFINFVNTFCQDCNISIIDYKGTNQGPS
jgi:hypothetical protein|tara:strand:+ start:1421 stop:5890 length:4470 start_codon:yes stop_codon:yes gene_type:complete